MDTNDTNRAAGTAAQTAGPDAAQDLQEIQRELLSRALPPETFLTAWDILERAALQDAGAAAGWEITFTAQAPAVLDPEALQDYKEAGLPCPYYAAMQLPNNTACPKITARGGCAYLPAEALCPWQAIPYEERKDINSAVVLLSKVNQELYSLLTAKGAFQQQIDGRFSYLGKFNVSPDPARPRYVKLEIADAPRPLKPVDLAIMSAIYAIVIDKRQLHFTDNQVLQALYMLDNTARYRHLGDFSETNLQQVRDSMETLRKAQVYINAKAQQGKGYPQLQAEIAGPMIPMVRITYKDQFGTQTDQYKLNDTCPLLDYNQQVRQMKVIAYKRLNAPRVKSKPSMEKAVIKDYITRRIAAAENRTNCYDNANKIDLRRLFKDLQLGGPAPDGLPYGNIKGDAAYKDRKRIAAVLDSLTDDPEACPPHKGMIRSWEWYPQDKRTKDGIIFNLE